MNTTKNKLYLVTGGAGFLGSHVCGELLSRGEKVRTLVLPHDPARQYVPKAVEVCEGDLCDRKSLEAFFAVSDACEIIVIHCASMVSVKPDYNARMMKVNVDGTRNIIDTCIASKNFAKLIYVSSTGAIPELPHGQKITEVDKFEADKVIGCYSQSKALASQCVLNAANYQNLNACIVHPSGILGPEDHAISETTGTIIKIINGEMPIGISGSFNLCDVRDLAHGCVLAADKGKQGSCYILANGEVTLRKVCEMLEANCDCKKPAFFLPLILAAPLAKVTESRARKKGHEPILTSFHIYNLARNNNFDYSKAKNELGYTTRSYEETIRDEVKWLEANSKIKGGSSGRTLNKSLT
jgi:dihydroflavonol-4-reductase